MEDNFGNVHYTMVGYHGQVSPHSTSHGPFGDTKHVIFLEIHSLVDQSEFHYRGHGNHGLWLASFVEHRCLSFLLFEMKTLNQGA